MARNGEDVVKSVGRVFEVIELFDRLQKALSATDVERLLGYPQSSTLALLKSMVSLGYLSFDRIERSYFPTMRITLLGQWIEQSIEGETGIRALMADIGAHTGETVSLVYQNDLLMQFLFVLPGTNPLTLNMQEGDVAPLFRSIVGMVALAQRHDHEIRKLAERINRRTVIPGERVDIEAALAEVAQIRRDGYGIGYSRYVPSIGAIAFPLAMAGGARTVVISVGGPVESIRARQDEIIASIGAILKGR